MPIFAEVTFFICDLGTTFYRKITIAHDMQFSVT